jgi:hypothetical protein
MVQAADIRIRTPGKSRASAGAPDRSAFLEVEFVPIERWQALTQRQRDLHLLWTKKLLPLYDDAERVHDADLIEGDRQVILWLLRMLAARAIPLRGPFKEVAKSSERVSFYAQLEMTEGKTTALVSINLVGPDGPGPIVIHLHNLRREIDIVVLWRAKDVPGRGTVSLYPQAFNSSRRFGIAAFNQHQFAGICRALVEYCALSTNRAVCPLPSEAPFAIPSRGPEPNR